MCASATWPGPRLLRQYTHLTPTLAPHSTETPKLPFCAQGLARGSYTLWALWVWLYCVFWWLVQDLAKVGAYRVMRRWVCLNGDVACVLAWWWAPCGSWWPVQDAV